MARLALLFVGALFLIQLSQGSVLRDRRDVSSSTSDAEKTIDQTLDSWKKGVEDFFKDGIQVDKIAKDVQDNFKELGAKVESVSKDFAKSVQTKTEELMNKAKE